MLNIRPDQMEVLSAVMRSGFEQRMLTHLRHRFPAPTNGRSDEQILVFIRYGIDRSAAYGITLDQDVARYLEYMMMYGARFDADPRYAWAARILQDADLSGTTKMDRVDEYDQFVLR